MTTGRLTNLNIYYSILRSVAVGEEAKASTIRSLPKEAHPQAQIKPGCKSYTVTIEGKAVQILLSHKAFYVVAAVAVPSGVDTLVVNKKGGLRIKFSENTAKTWTYALMAAGIAVDED